MKIDLQKIKRQEYYQRNKEKIKMQRINRTLEKEDEILEQKFAGWVIFHFIYDLLEHFFGI